MSKKCFGCGVTLQYENSNKKGYIPQEKYKVANYCERCFKITNYNSKIIVPLDNVNEKIIKEVNKNGKYVFFLIDLLNINKETICSYKKINVAKTLVISKLDIIPKSIKQKLIDQGLRDVYGIEENIMFLSSRKKINISKIPRFLEENNLKEAYILGYTNAGKSTLINNLSIKYGISNNKITTSLIPNTTLDFIKIKLSDNLTIIDSPGFVLNKTLYNDEEFNLMKRINLKDFLKPKTFQVKAETNLIIEDKIRINSDISNSMTFYVSNDLNIVKVYNSDKLFDKCKKIIDINDNSDIVIKGIGFINIKKACRLTIYSDFEDLIEVRDSMFKKV